MNRWREEDSVDPNKDNFIEETSVSQRAFLRVKIESLGGHKNCGRNNAFTQFDLVDELKRNPDFANKSRIALWYLIKNFSRWEDKEIIAKWNPEQEAFIRKKLQVLDANKLIQVGKKRTVEVWLDSHGKRISKKKAAQDLFNEKNPILGDKTLESIEIKINQRNKWM